MLRSRSSAGSERPWSMAVLLREVNMNSDQYLYRVNEVRRCSLTL